MIVFITFSSCGEKYTQAAQRLMSQAYSTQCFDKLVHYDEKSLINDTEFWNMHANFIINNSRGYGYWIWKPYLIMKTMKSMSEGDILLYLDAGCEIDTQKISKFQELFRVVKKDKIVGSTTKKEKDWNKMDLINYLNMNNNCFLSTPQRQAGALCFCICSKVQNLVHQWYNISCKYNLLDDSQSIVNNFPGFKEHRHDQAIFSLLSKKQKIFSKYSIKDVINYSRNLSGVSKISCNNKI